MHARMHLKIVKNAIYHSTISFLLEKMGDFPEQKMASILPFIVLRWGWIVHVVQKKVEKECKH